MNNKFYYINNICKSNIRSFFFSNISNSICNKRINSINEIKIKKGNNNLNKAPKKNKINRNIDIFSDLKWRVDRF